MIASRVKVEKPKREKVKADPAHVKAARELRDKYLERFNDGELVLPEAKYKVAKALPASPVQTKPVEVRQLPQAA